MQRRVALATSTATDTRRYRGDGVLDHGRREFWIVENGRRIGLVRLLDLGDIGEGAPLFDLRIAGRHRRSGFGARATRWIVDHLFSTYPEVHRIEANTRHDNVAMQRALSDAGFVNEGRLRDAWWGEAGQWFDTMIYGIRRVDVGFHNERTYDI